MKEQSSDLGHQIEDTVLAYRMADPLSIQTDRSHMRKVCTEIIPAGHADWLAFSSMIDAYIDREENERGPINREQLYDIWLQVAKGLKGVAA